MKTLAAIILLCVTVVSVATIHEVKDYQLSKQKLDIEQQQLQLDILKYIRAQQDKAERQLQPQPQKPSLDLRNLRG